MDTEELKILSTEIAAVSRDIERIYQRIDERSGIETAPGLESLSYQLHNLYSAFEELFEIVAKTFENHVADEGGYHIGLLRRMNVAVEGVRPAFVPDGLLPKFDSLRSFRHFFRHAYGTEMDRRKVRPVLEDANELRTRYPEMIAAFLEALR
jgi:uncharacterized protein YutE (UPF0331/DUF86 family)